MSLLQKGKKKDNYKVNVHEAFWRTWKRDKHTYARKRIVYRKDEIRNKFRENRVKFVSKNKNYDYNDTIIIGILLIINHLPAQKHKRSINNQ